METNGGEIYTIKRSIHKNLGDGVVHYGFIQNLCNNDNLKLIHLTQDCSSTNYLLIGSVLTKCDKNSIICGTGFISEKDDLGSLKWSFSNTIYNKPKQILFVRGPKTRNKLIKMGAECPESYGDLGLLLPLVYPMKKSPIYKYKVGILPHYIDVKDTKPLIDFLKGKNISYTILNICKADKCQEFINELSEVEFLISSTLHGIITGIAYNVKTIWVKFSDKVTGNSFKYEDFFSSMGYTYTHVNIDDDIFNNTINIPKNKIKNIGLNMLKKIPFFPNENVRKNKIRLWKNLLNSY